MANIKLVIFDLDGTLLDTIEDLGDSVNEVLSSRDFPEHTYDQYCLYVNIVGVSPSVTPCKVCM